MAEAQRYPSGAEPRIVIHHVSGDLSVDGWMQEEIAVFAPEAVVDNQAGKGEAIEIRCNGDCRLQAPHGASIHVMAVAGDAHMDSIQGMVEFSQVSGDLQIQRTGATTIGQVNGDFAVRHVEGTLNVKGANGDGKAHHVNGDIEIEQVNGDLRLHIVGKTVVGQVGGDLAARHVGGDLHVERVGGDANINRVDGSVIASGIGDDLTLLEPMGNVQATAGDDISLRIDPQAQANYAIFAGGDAVCRVPLECNASFALQAGGEIGVHRLPVEGDGGERQRSITLGDGDAQVAITAGGDISLIGSDMNWDDGAGIDIGMEIGLRAGELAQQVASQVEAQVQAAASQLDRKLSELANNDDLVLRIQDKVQSAMGVAEIKISEAMRQAEHSIKEAEARSAQAEAERRRQQQRWRVNKPAQPTKPSTPPVSDEERLIILRMVDDGKISVEQAEQLLAALRPKAQG